MEALWLEKRLRNRWKEISCLVLVGFNADTDMDPAFDLNADPDTELDPESQTNGDPCGSRSGSRSDFYVTKNCIFTWKIYLEMVIGQKKIEVIQKPFWKAGNQVYLTSLFHAPGSGSGSTFPIERIRIQNSEMNADPCGSISGFTTLLVHKMYNRLRSWEKKE